MKAAAPSRVLWLLAILVFATAIACGHGSTSTDTGTPIDTDLMAFLSEARALHHEANLKEDDNDLDGALAAMDRLVAARRPRAAPEVEEVLADAYARMGELRLKKGDLAPAADAIHRGLEHAPEPTYFRGHLLEVEGLVEEARAASLADAGKPAEAKQAREHAILLLESVVKIQDQVIQRSLANKAAGAEAGR
jgi:tetratricopeptide (TPR) repeat protein